MNKVNMTIFPVPEMLKIQFIKLSMSFFNNNSIIIFNDPISLSSSPYRADIFQCSLGSLDLLQENIHTEQGVI